MTPTATHVIVTGGPGAGKTTLLAALAAHVPRGCPANLAFMTINFVVVKDSS